MSTFIAATKRRSVVLVMAVFAAACALVVLAAVFGTHQVNSDDAPEISFDGLHLRGDSKAAIAYVKPDADFSGYDSFMMLDAYVAFKKNWERRTKVAGRRISNKDVERIKTEAAALLHETFRQELDDNGGYQFVEQSGDSVLILRPALIDMDITAPDVKVAGRVNSYVASAGSATLFLELYDSVSGEILARLVDRRNAQQYGTAMWANKTTNRNEAKKMFRRWATQLRSGLDEIRAEAGQPILSTQE
ncbi:MAG: hypothetical protein ACI9NT_002669 [Bacteroidia bacterium]|jgi:hypothetical protein